MTTTLPAGTPIAVRGLACATVALAPLEGYVTAVHPHLAKLAPALLVVVWLTARVRERQAPRRHVAHALLAALTVVLLVSAAVRADGPFTAEYTARWLPFLVLTVVLIDVATREVPVRHLFTAAVAGAVVAGAGALHSVLVAGAPRATGPLEDPNDLAFVLVVAVPLLVAARPAGRARVPAVLAAVVLVAGAAATVSRGGALALAAATAVLLVRGVLPARVLARALAAVAVAVPLAVLAAGPTLARAVQEKSHIAASNVDARELRWQAAARMLAEHPVLGVGPGGFRSEYAAASHDAEPAEQTPVAHNMFLEVAAELGLPGFCLFTGLVAVALVATERVLRAGGDRAAMVGVQAAVAAVAVAATFLSEQYYLPLWLLVAIAVAADLGVRRGGVAGAGAPRHQ